MAPFRLKNIDHLVLLVDDMAAALRFYRDGLGAAVGERLDDYGMIELTTGASHVSLVDVASEAGAWARPATTGGKNMDHFCLAIERATLAAVRAHAVAQGWPIVEETRDSLYVLDPAGNQVELHLPG